jgi:hypothetical protein
MNPGKRESIRCTSIFLEVLSPVLYVHLLQVWKSIANDRQKGFT